MKLWRRAQRRQQAGFSLIELIIAMSVLSVGVLGTLAMMTTAMTSNTKNVQDNGATAMAQMVLDQIAAVPANSNPQLTVQDCTAGGGQNWIINTAGGGQPLGAGALINFNTGDIDWVNQNYAAVPAGYKMQYASCGVNGNAVIYDVRWNVTALPNNFTKLITVSARPLASAANPTNTRLFALPVTLRTIGGM